MTPGGEFLTGLNRPAADASHYYALASDYDPVSPALKEWVQTRLTSALFSHVDNDLVVPTAGVYDSNGSPQFPIADCQLFGPADGVTHSGYFDEASGSPRLLEWLAG